MSPRALLLTVSVVSVGAHAAPASVVGVEAGVMMRQESAGDYSPHPWLGIRGGVDLHRWVRLTASYGLSYGLEGNWRSSSSAWEHRLALIPEATLSLGGPRLHLGLGVLGDLRAVSFRDQGVVFSNAVVFSVGPAATAGLDVDVRELRVRFGIAAVVLRGRLDWSFTVALERLFAESHQ